MREVQKRQGGCDLHVAKSSSVWQVCFIQYEAAEREDQPGMDGFVPAVAKEREGRIEGKYQKEEEEQGMNKE